MQKNHKNPKPCIGDILSVKDFRMDGSHTEHVGLIYDIRAVKKSHGLPMVHVHWIRTKPYDYDENLGYSVNSVIREYDQFKIIVQVNNA